MRERFVSPCVRYLQVYLHIENGKDANLVSQHAFCPVLIHSPDYSQYLILDREEMSEAAHKHTIDALSLNRPSCFVSELIDVRV